MRLAFARGTARPTIRPANRAMGVWRHTRARSLVRAHANARQQHSLPGRAAKRRDARLHCAARERGECESARERPPVVVASGRLQNAGPFWRVCCMDVNGWRSPHDSLLVGAPADPGGGGGVPMPTREECARSRCRCGWGEPKHVQEGRRPVDEPTLFYMPHCGRRLYRSASHATGVKRARGSGRVGRVLARSGVCDGVPVSGACAWAVEARCSNSRPRGFEARRLGSKLTFEALQQLARRQLAARSAAHALHRRQLVRRLQQQASRPGRHWVLEGTRGHQRALGGTRGSLGY